MKASGLFCLLSFSKSSSAQVVASSALPSSINLASNKALTYLISGTSNPSAKHLALKISNFVLSLSQDSVSARSVSRPDRTPERTLLAPWFVAPSSKIPISSSSPRIPPRTCSVSCIARATKTDILSISLAIKSFSSSISSSIVSKTIQSGLCSFLCPTISLSLFVSEVDNALC